jgi:hypothetical protein
MLFAVWSDRQYRATQDMDLLGTGSNSPDELVRVFHDISQVAAPAPDGMTYLADSITAAAIREDLKYEGVRVRIESRLGNARIPLTVDVGFGDAVTPAPAMAEFPVLLDAPAPAIKMYPREAVVAEKLEALVSLGQDNSRMKDFADLWFLARHFAFDGPLLAKAVASTFRRRQTALDGQPVALTPAFARAAVKQAQWTAFVRRTSPEGIPSDLAEVIEGIAAFVVPILEHLAGGRPVPRTWVAAGPWQA